MTDREKIIETLKEIADCFENGSKEEESFWEERSVIWNLIELLKEESDD